MKLVRSEVGSEIHRVTGDNLVVAYLSAVECVTIL
jgi:hypothetical protein